MLKLLMFVALFSISMAQASPDINFLKRVANQACSGMDFDKPFSNSAIRQCQATAVALLNQAQASGEMKLGQFIIRLCGQLPTAGCSYQDCRNNCFLAASVMSPALEQGTDVCVYNSAVSDDDGYRCYVKILNKMVAQ